MHDQASIIQSLLSLLAIIVILLVPTKWFLSRLLGRDATNQMIGTLAADVVRFIFLLPFKVIKWLLRRMRLIK